MGQVIELRNNYPSYSKAKVFRERKQMPPSIASKYEKPTKENFIQTHQKLRRFNNAVEKNEP